jgi:hypothetical protein
MRSEKPRIPLLTTAIVATALFALPACDSAAGISSLPNDDDAGLSDGAANACFAQNVCSQHADCLPATCDCAGQKVAANERCVNHCCLSVYAACQIACADAGADAGGGADADAAVDADADDGSAVDDAASDAPDAATDS